MAHQIENNEIAWVGAKPWHGLGVEVQPGATGIEMLTAAKLNWQVELRELAFMLPGTTNDLVNPLNNFRAVTRSDNDKVFNVVSKWYNPVQNEQIVDFFKEYCEAGHASLETVGAVRGGAVVWALAKLSSEASKKILEDDVVEGYMLLATAHDGTMATTARGTQVRVVCANTLAAAWRDRAGASNQVRIHHSTKWTKEVVEQAQKQLGMMTEELAYTNELCAKLAAVGVDDKGWMEFMGKLLGEDMVKDDKGVLKPTASAIYEATKTSPGANLKSAKDTLWGAVNGVTYFADYVRGTDENRLRGAWFGDGNRMKNDALRIATEMAGVLVG